ncbi:MAG: hypothetical protein K6E98_11525 [Lachnospiraceae bacterium]|nr:hypothetical protein [Lachnospiraceae bacterium]
MTKKISDDLMENVNGGFMETDLASKAYHKVIECPYCHETNQEKIELKSSGDILKPGAYHCKTCNSYFDVK